MWNYGGSAFLPNNHISRNWVLGYVLYFHRLKILRLRHSTSDDRMRSTVARHSTEIIRQLLDMLDRASDRACPTRGIIWCEDDLPGGFECQFFDGFKCKVSLQPAYAITMPKTVNFLYTCHLVINRLHLCWHDKKVQYIVPERQRFDTSSVSLRFCCIFSVGFWASAFWHCLHFVKKAYISSGNKSYRLKKPYISIGYKLKCNVK